MSLDWWLAAALAAPHILYAYIWFFPDSWRKVFRARSVQAFEASAWLGKGCQFLAALLWYLSSATFDPLSTPVLHWLGAAVLVACGQALNVGIYKAIGANGVYYGFKLGHRVPWVTGFPFNVTAHPQYVGSVLTVWGLALLVWRQGPPGVGLVALYWTGLYVITALQEQFL